MIYMHIEEQNIHLIGIGGIGLSAVAKLLVAYGKTVSGSDLHESDITHDLKRRGVLIQSGHSVDHVSDKTELVIYSSAIPENNVERVQAKTLGIKEMSYFEFLGEMSKHYSTIAVTGTNGKSTTTAMLGLMLEAGGYDPTVIVGSLVPGFEEGNLRVGKGRFFVVEGCEYKANMLQLNPEMITLTNIEEDHLDFYRDLDHIKETFQDFVNKLIGKGITIFNADDEESRKLKFSRSVSYGMEHDADYSVSDRHVLPGKQRFSVSRSGDGILGEITLQVPGRFNIENAMAATSSAMELGIPFEICKQVLENFTGIWRRFERVGRFRDADIISDYGHHPTAITSTLKASREFFPDRRIILCFQPHQHSRTKELMDEFVDALSNADQVIISEIYSVSGRTEEDQVSSKDIIEKIKKKHPSAEVVYAKDLDEAEDLIRDLVKEEDVLIVQGAGDVDEVARKMVL